METLTKTDPTANYCDPILIADGDFANTEEYLTFMENAAAALGEWAETTEGLAYFKRLKAKNKIEKTV